MPLSPLNRALLLLCSALLVILLGFWALPVDDSWTDVAAIQPLPTPPLAIKSSLPLEPIDNLVTRPIFDPSRGTESAAPSAESMAPPPAQLTLAGLIIGTGEKIALIRSPDSKDVIVAHEGDTVSNWLIKEIDQDRVVITTNGTTEELSFSKTPGAAPAVPGEGVETAPGVHSY